MSTVLPITRGYTGRWDVSVTDSEGAVVDVTGCTFRMAFYATPPARSATTDSGAALTLTSGSGITITNAAGGILSVIITPAQAATLTRAQYSFDLRMTNAAEEIYPAASGFLLLYDQSTHSA